MSDQDQRNHPTVLFICTHNAGRSQIAAGYMKALSKGNINALSAGTAPKDSINPWVVAAMAEDGIDISSNVPKALDQASIEKSDIVITMGCGESQPIIMNPLKRHEDWALVNPVGKSLETVRPIRDEIKKLIEKLILEFEVID